MIVFLLMGSSTGVRAQSNVFPPDFPAEYPLSYFDYQVAYATVGWKAAPVTTYQEMVNGVTETFYDWKDGILWADLNKGSWTEMSTYAPLTGRNKVLFYVQHDDHVKVANEPGNELNYQNKLSLLICGKLILGSMVFELPFYVDLMLIESYVDSDPVTPNTAKFAGQVNNQVFDVNNLLVPVKEAGFLIGPEGIDVLDFATHGNTYKFPVPGFVLNSDPVFDFLLEDFNPPFGFTEGSNYTVYAYAINNEDVLMVSEPAYGTYPINFTYTPPETGKAMTTNAFKVEDGKVEPFLEKDGGTVSINNMQMILCDTTSYFHLNQLIVKNNADLEINGTFEVDYLEVGNNSNIWVNDGGVLNADSISAGLNSTITVAAGGTINTDTIFMDANYCIIVEDGGAIYVDPVHVDLIPNSREGCDFVLPVALLHLTPEVKAGQVILTWATGTETNSNYFTIERSRSLTDWSVLGFMEAAGNSQVPTDYRFTDLHPLDGLAYYRLKQTDQDGQFKYYGPVEVNYDMGIEGLDFKVLKQYSTWVIAVPNDGFYQIEVYNLQGHRLHSEKVENNLSIPAPEGAVVIRVTDGFARSASRVVM
jgi:hypothetical protein